MQTPRLVADLIPWVWAVWAATSAATVLGVWRRDISGSPARQRTVWVLLALCALQIIVSFALPARVDASGLMELHDGDTPWKGAVGDGVVAIARAAFDVGHLGIILTTRLFLLAGGLLTATLVCSAAKKSAWTMGGIDLELLLASVALLLTPSFAFGVVGVFNFWFYGVVVLALLLGLLELPREPTWPTRLTVLSSLVLIGFARPETIVAAVVAGALIGASAFRRGDRGTWIPSAILTCVLAAAAPSMFTYLDDRVRHQPLLMGNDTAHEAAPLSVLWLLVRRVAEHLPLNLLVLTVALHVLGAFAIVHGARMLRTRWISHAELVALGLLVVEFLAIGVHREGFLRYVKYGQLVVVPVWFLALGCILTTPSDRRRARMLVAATIGASLLWTAQVVLTVAGVGHCATEEGRARSGRMQDMTLLWRTAPEWAQATCTQQRTGQIRLAVVQLDELGADAAQQRPPKPEGPSCEPERWPIWHQFQRRGCATAIVVPRLGARVREALCDPIEGVLRGPLEFGSIHPSRQVPTHAIVTFYRAERAEEVRDALHDGSCGWRIDTQAPSALLLERVP